MDRRSFITWVTAVGATLTLPVTVRPSRKWTPANMFWVSKQLDLPNFELKELFFPAEGEYAERPPRFQFGDGWKQQWHRDVSLDFPLGSNSPTGGIKITNLPTREVLRDPNAQRYTLIGV